jgi:OFA family oxalate/formate antiporter-like MFS transporter
MKAHAPSANASPMQKKGIYYGWYIVLAAFIGNFLGSGTTFYIFNAFIEPLIKLRGWTRTEINIAPMIGYAVNLLGVLMYGTLVIRFGPRRLMIFGSLVSAASFFLLGFASNLFLFYMLFILLFFGIGGMSGIVTATAVNNWFVLKVGSALGIATVGISLSGVVMPPIAQMILEEAGIIYAFFWIGVAISLVAPLSWLIVKTKPEDMGLLPDGVRHADGAVYDDLPFRDGPDAQAQDTRPSHWTFSMVIRNQAFWKIGLAYGFSLTAILGVMFQLKPRFSDVGFDSGTAMKLMAATAMAGAAGKYFWAYMCDRFTAKKVIAVLMFFNAAGLVFILIPGSVAAVALFIIVYGFSMGGVVSTQHVLVADFFGREAFSSFARYSGIIVGIDSVGYLIMGRSYDLTGSYDMAYIAFIILNLIAALLIVSLRKPG